MKNFNLKVIAVLITLILYIFVNSQSNRKEVTIELPIQFQNLPDDKFILLPTEREVLVTIRGPSHKLNSYTDTLEEFTLPLPDIEDNNLEIILKTAYLDLPSSIDAVKIEPSKLNLVLADIIDKTVPVEVPKIGKINDNYKLISLEVEPQQITVNGPDTEVNEIDKVETEPLDLRNLKNSDSKVLEIRNPGSFTSVNPTEVQVNFDIANISQEKEYKAVKVEVRSGDYGGFKIEPDQVDIEISGPKSKIKKIKAKDLNPYIKIEKTVSNKTLMNVKIDLPEDVTVIKIEPAQINVIPAVVTVLE